MGHVMWIRAKYSNMSPQQIRKMARMHCSAGWHTVAFQKMVWDDLAALNGFLIIFQPNIRHKRGAGGRFWWDNIVGANGYHGYTISPRKWLGRICLYLNILGVRGWGGRQDHTGTGGFQYTFMHSCRVNMYGGLYACKGQITQVAAWIPGKLLNTGSYYIKHFKHKHTLVFSTIL